MSAVLPKCPGYTRPMIEPTLPRLGRRRDADLTRRFQAGALTLVGAQGYHQLKADAVAAHVGAGKAGLYRRWPDVTSLLADAIAQLALVPTVEPTGTARGDLIALLNPWTHPLNAGEEAVAAVQGFVRHLPQLRAAVDLAVTTPLTEQVRTIIGWHAQQGNRVSPAQRAVLVMVVRALWWERYVNRRPPHAPAELAQLVDQVLLPIIAKN